jgi:hypothetical protein
VLCGVVQFILNVPEGLSRLALEHHVRPSSRCTATFVTRLDPCASVRDQNPTVQSFFFLRTKALHVLMLCSSLLCSSCPFARPCIFCTRGLHLVAFVSGTPDVWHQTGGLMGCEFMCCVACTPGAMHVDAFADTVHVSTSL